MAFIKVNTDKKLNQISPLLYGAFFEDINYGGDGGLYAELVANRSFEYYDRENVTDKHKMCWEAMGDTDFKICTEKPLNNIHTHYANVNGGRNSGIKNLGFCKEGFSTDKDSIFIFSCYVRVKDSTRICAVISDASGNALGTGELTCSGGEWQKYKTEITINSKCKNAYLSVILPNGGSADLEFISLFPKDTFCGRENGMRKDIAEMIADMKPRFMRFPGGCIVEGINFENMYNWKDTIGILEERRTNWNRWQLEKYQRYDYDSSDYFQSYGIGFYEYFQFCEDIGAKPVPVVNCGMTCQWHEGLLIDLDKLESFIQDIFDLIEFANGDENSEWGKKRAKMGHKEPFNLEYIGIGNEQWGNEYFERYEIFQKRISEKYPDIRLITSAGWKDCGCEFDLAYDWIRNNKEKAYAVDEHFYKEPEWFLENINRYDNYNRALPKIFIGEYAAHMNVDKDSPMYNKRNNWYSALVEAAFLTGVEKNSDHVIMTGYAPLLARTGHQQWQPDLIWFDNTIVYGTPNYYVQKLFSEYSGEYAVDYECSDNDIKVSASVKGGNLILKLVNISDEDKSIEFDIDRNFEINKQILLHAEPLAENSPENPHNVYPAEVQNERVLKEYSVMIVEINI